ncbi:hypothetical protein [Candidatus Darwinibacter acetoxidans]|jgi:hypothetical protein
MATPKIIPIGPGAYVDAEQIVAVDDYNVDFPADILFGFADYAKAAVLLKTGDTVLAYVMPSTVARRWKDAVNGD